MKMKTEREIDAMINMSWDFEQRYSRESYAEGVRAALDWAYGRVEEPPFDEEEA